MLCVSKLCVPNPWLVTLDISHAPLKPLSLKGDIRVAGYLFFSGAPILFMIWWHNLAASHLLVSFSLLPSLPPEDTSFHKRTPTLLCVHYDGTDVMIFTLAAE